LSAITSPHTEYFADVLLHKRMDTAKISHIEAAAACIECWVSSSRQTECPTLVSNQTPDPRTQDARRCFAVFGWIKMHRVPFVMWWPGERRMCELQAPPTKAKREEALCVILKIWTPVDVDVSVSGVILCPLQPPA
jgi:hypothetical protein